MLYLLLILLVLGVVSAAAGTLLEEEFHITGQLGMGLMLLLVAGLVFFGRDVLERILALWSAGMYVIFVLYFYLAWQGTDTGLAEALGTSGLLGSLGIVSLIGKGYSALAVGFALVYVLPLLTLGVYRLSRREAGRSAITTWVHSR